MKARLFSTSPNKHRTQTFGFRLSEHEKAWLLDAAESLELRPADALRRALGHYAACSKGLKADTRALSPPLPAPPSKSGKGPRPAGHRKP